MLNQCSERKKKKKLLSMLKMAVLLKRLWKINGNFFFLSFFLDSEHIYTKFQNIYISYKCCSFELFIDQIIMEKNKQTLFPQNINQQKLFPTLIIIKHY